MLGHSLELEQDLDIVREYCDNQSERAATAFVRKYQNFIYMTAFRYLQTHHDADDASQEVLIKALKNLHKFRADSGLKTWLYRITINVCNNMKRKKKFFSFLGEEGDKKYLNVADSAQDPESSLASKQFEENFLEALNKLPEKQRETFSLRYFEQLSYEEISDILGTTVGGLKANYFQAVKKLATLLKKEAEDYHVS